MAILAAVTALLISACEILLGPDEPAGTGILSIGFDAGGRRAAVPTDEELAALRYDLVLTGPGDQKITVSLDPGQTFNEQVALGEWDIEAKAYNSDDVLIGRGSATVTVKAGKNEARVWMEPTPAYGISLSSSGTYTFPAAFVGYGTLIPHTVTVSNTGNEATGALTAGLSGTGSGSFTLSATTISSIGVSGSDTFTVVPNTGLAEGTYTATVTVSGNNGISENFTVSFTVNSTSGGSVTYTGDGVTFRTVIVPGGHSFPTGMGDSGTATVAGAYEIGETEITYELWHTVRDWAEDHGYTFSNNPGREGSSATGENTEPGENRQEPVTMVTWFDAVVWLNALTEWVKAKSGSNLTPVYYYDSAYDAVAKDSTPTSHFEKEDGSHTYASAYAKEGATGFRLPTSNEWELAARWRNDSTNTVSGYTDPYFTKGNSVSGATADYNDAEATEAVAWYSSNSSSKTQAVKGKAANGLGLYDMSGNVWEWCYEWHPSYTGSDRIIRGGAWDFSTDGLRVGYVRNHDSANRGNYGGFRPARTAQ
jgi:formylglycine-generating enzyme required for sulfatase activity